MWLADLAQRVRGLSGEGFVFILLLLLVATAAAFYFIWRSLHRARIIEDTPTARVRSAHQGYVELEGEGRLLEGPPIIGPLSGKHCLWYRFRIEHRESSHGNRGQSHWSTVRSGVSDGLFMLDDGTGRCIIDPEGAEVIPGAKDVWYGHQEQPQQGPPRSRSWLRLGGGDYRYTEERLMPGPLYALGWFNTVRNASGDVNTEVTALLRDWKGDQPALLARFDADRDGHISATEWDKARAAALQEVIRLRAHRPVTPDSHVLGRSPSDRQPFLLSAQSAQQLVARYRRRTTAALIATFIGVIVTLWVLDARFALFGG